MVYHITKSGNVAECNATIRNCPLGGAHFSNEDEAYQWLEVDSGGVFESISSTIYSRPTWDYSSAGFRGFQLNPDAVDEKKNKGDYSEVYGAFYLVSEKSENVGFYGQKPWILESMVLGDRDQKTEIIRDEEGYLYINNGEKIISISPFSETEIKSLHEKIQKGPTSDGSTFHIPEMKEKCVRIGLTDGKIPKAPSKSKADLICWDDRGIEHRISIKSFIGFNPTLINVSQASETKFVTSLPNGVSESEIKEYLEKASQNKTPTKEIVSELKRKGIVFNPEEGIFSSGTTPQGKDYDFGQQLDSIDPEARKAYSCAVFQVADSNVEIPSSKKDAYYKTLATFATRMTHTELGNKTSAVNEFMFINGRSGTPELRKFSDDLECGEYFSKRLSFSEASKGGSRSGVFEVENGKISLILNSQGKLSQDPVLRKK